MPRAEAVDTNNGTCSTSARGSTKESGGDGSRGVNTTSTRASARGINATASACTGARGRYDGEAASTSTSTSGEAASACTRAGGNAAPTTADAADAIDGRLLGNGGHAAATTRNRGAAAAGAVTAATGTAAARDGAGGRRRRVRDAVPAPTRGPDVGRARRDARAPRPLGIGG